MRPGGQGLKRARKGDDMRDSTDDRLYSDPGYYVRIQKTKIVVILLLLTYEYLFGTSVKGEPQCCS